MQKEVSIFFITYNPDWMKMRRALLSCIRQVNINFEIIISDDGSENNYFREIADFFEKYSFKDYKLVEGCENQGTCKNVYKAIRNASGEYIRGMTDGECFISDTIIGEWYRWCKERRAKVSFGNAVFYSYKHEFKCYRMPNSPINLWVYNNKMLPKSVVIEDYLLHSDFICGASFMLCKEFFTKYILMILEHVKYAEDNAYRLMMYDSVTFDYYDRNVIFYEYGTGISTSSNIEWKKLLAKDIQATNRIILENKPKTFLQKRIQRYFKLVMLNKINKSRLYKYLGSPWGIILFLAKILCPQKTPEVSLGEKRYFYKLLELTRENKENL